MLSVIAAQNRNSQPQVVQKCARRLIDGTQLLLLLLLYLHMLPYLGISNTNGVQRIMRISQKSLL